MTLRRASKITAPVEIARWPKNRAGEEIRVNYSSYEDIDLLNIRIWTPDDGGGFRPSKKGIAISAPNLSAFLKAMREAYRKAVELELVPPEPSK